MGFGVKAATFTQTIFLAKSSVFLLVIFLFGCAGGGVKQPVVLDVNSMSHKTTQLKIDSDVELNFKNAIVLMQQQQYAQAVPVLKAVIAEEKRLPAPFVNIAIAHNKLGDTEAAEKNLISALKLDIGHPVANNELGLLYRKKGKFKAARIAYENAIKDHPEYLPAIRNLGILCDLYMRDFDCALEQFEQYLELKPNDKTVAIWVADVKRRINN